MKEFLYIQFYDNVNSTIPYNSWKVGDKNELSSRQHIVGLVDNIVNWMELYPNGKVDFVWLSNAGI